MTFDITRQDPYKLLGYFVTLIAAYCIGTVAQNLFFSPLSKYPGSWWYIATPFPRLWLYVTGREPFVVLDMHERYGPIVRIAPNELSFIDAQAWADIYGHKATTNKDPTFYPFSPGAKHSIILADNENHHRMRKIMLPAFSARALREQNSLLSRYITTMVRVLSSKQQAGEEFDIVRAYVCTSFDIMADLTFGESLGLSETQVYSPWVQSIFDQIFYASISRTVQYFPLVWMVAQRFIPKSLKDAAEASAKHSSERVDKRLKMGSDRPDIFGLILRSEEGSKMPLNEMHSNADLLMAAGTDTTATMLSGLTYNLLKNPVPMGRLVKEIRDTFQTDADMTIDALPKLPYLSACLEEGLRTFPSVGEGIRRKTDPQTGAEICGHMIPGNVGVSVPHYAAYHSPYNFVDCNDFIPERWLAEGTEGYDPRFLNDKKDVLQPFSTGPRNCLGMSLAYHEMRLMIAHLFWNFDVELGDSTSKTWLDQTVHVSWDKKPLFVKLSPRQGVNA